MDAIFGTSSARVAVIQSVVPRKRRSSKPETEWIGGYLTTPIYLAGDRADSRPERLRLAIWLEMPADRLHAMEPAVGEDGSAFLAETLRDALADEEREGPLPVSIRVADPAAAALLREDLGSGGPRVVVGPTPELKRIVREYHKDHQRILRPSYTDHGRLSDHLVAGLFRAALRLHETAPWERINGGEPFRMDIPHLPERELCVSVVDVDGIAGLFILRSVADMDDFLEQNRRDLVAEAEGRECDEAEILRVETLFLTFKHATDLPLSMRREALERGWPVAAPHAYPLLERRDPHGIRMPLTDRDLLIAEFAADVTAAFCHRHEDHLALGEPHACRSSEDYVASVYSNAVVTIPYDAPSQADRRHAGPSLRLAHMLVPREPTPSRPRNKRPRPR